jgi:ABC-2 type transport system permease protein
MTTMSTGRPGIDRSLNPTPPQPGPLTQVGRSLAAEWVKLRSVRSTVLSLLCTVAVCVGFATLVAFGTVSRWDQMPAARQASFEPSTFSVSGVIFGQLVIGALGVLAMSAEYSTGTIRATLSAVPQRLTVLVTKTVVFALTALGVALVTTFSAFLVAQAILSQKHIGTSLSAPGVPRIVIGAALFLTSVSLLGLGLATVLRHTAGAISTLFGLMLVLPILSNFLPSDWQEHVNRYLPLNAGMAIMKQHPEANSFGAWTGLAVMYGYALAALVIGGILMTRRDA